MKIEDILKKQGEIYKNLRENKTIQKYNKKIKKPIKDELKQKPDEFEGNVPGAHCTSSVYCINGRYYTKIYGGNGEWLPFGVAVDPPVAYHNPNPKQKKVKL